MANKRLCTKRTSKDNEKNGTSAKNYAKGKENKSALVKADSQPSNMQTRSSKRASLKLDEKPPETKKQKMEEVVKPIVKRRKRSVGNKPASLTANKALALIPVPDTPPNNISMPDKTVAQFVHKDAAISCQKLTIQSTMQVQANNLNLKVYENIVFNCSVSSSNNLSVKYEQQCNLNNQSSAVRLVSESSAAPAEAFFAFKRKSMFNCSIL